MADVPSGKYSGRLRHPVTGELIDAKDEENFMKCPARGGMIDCRDLAVVMAHLPPLPHPAQDATN